LIRDGSLFSEKITKMLERKSFLFETVSL